MAKGAGGKKGGLVGGLLFGGIFASVGLGFLFLSIIPTLYEAWQMQGWQPVQAEVLSAHLNRNSSSDGTTYNASASYRYRWQGRDYTANRVGIDTGSDNIGDWHQQQYRRLKRAADNKRNVTVWVDPQAPQNAIVDRDIRWGLFAFKMIFVVAFGGAGLGIMIFMLKRRPTISDSETPWLENPAWRNNRIRSGGKAVLWILWIFGILWSLFMIPLWMNVEELQREGMPLSLLPYIFPLIGVAVLAQAFIKTLRWRRFGNAELSLHPFPGESGGRVSGRIEVALDHHEQTPVEVRLSCIHVYWRRSGSKRERREEILWQDSRRVRIAPGPRGGVIAFDFTPPRGLPSSSEGSEHHKWVVDVRAKISGPDLEHRFTIPVFAAEGEGEAAEPVAQSSFVKDMPLSAESLPAWLKPAWHHGGIELQLPMFRNVGVAFVLLLMGLIFGGAGGFMLQQGEAPFLFALLFALVGGALFLGGLYSLGNSLQVHVSSRGVALVRRVFGIPFSKTVAAAEIRGLDKRIGVQSGNRAYYRVFLNTRSGKRHTLADSLPSVSAADYLIEQLSGQLRLEKSEQGHGAPEIPPVALEIAQKIQGAQRWFRWIGVIIFLVFLGQFIFVFFDF